MVISSPYDNRTGYSEDLKLIWNATLVDVESGLLTLFMITCVVISNIFISFTEILPSVAVNKACNAIIHQILTPPRSQI